METTFGLKIGEIRRALKLSQQQLGAKLGVGGGAVSKYERGAAEPSISALKILAKLGNITVDELITGNELKEENNQLSDQDKDLLALIQKLSPGKKELAKIVLKDMAKPD